MKLMAIFLVPVALGMASQGVMAQGCGHCHEKEDPFSMGDTLHQMVDHNPKLRTCDIGDGSHDCENGDGDEWWPENCAPHTIPIGGCSAFVELRIMLSGTPRLDPHDATWLSTEYPQWVSYDRIAQRVVVRDCSGAVVKRFGVSILQTLGAARGVDQLGSGSMHRRIPWTYNNTSNGFEAEAPILEPGL